MPVETWKGFSGSAKHSGINFRELHFKITSFLQKVKQTKTLYHLDEKTAKNGYLYVQFSQKVLFKVKTSFTIRSAWSKIFSRLAKICSPRKLYSLSLLGQNAAWTNLLLVKKKRSQKNSGSDSKRQNIANKTVIAAEATTFCIKPLTHYLSRSALKNGETWTTVNKRNKMQQNFILKTFGNVKKFNIIKVVKTW